jgi:hypothetical protein
MNTPCAQPSQPIVTPVVSGVHGQNQATTSYTPGQSFYEKNKVPPPPPMIKGVR